MTDKYMTINKKYEKAAKKKVRVTPGFKRIKKGSK